MTALAPITLFIYNRPWHTRKCLESLVANPEAKDSVLYIFADGPKSGASAETLESIAAARAVAKEKQWCGEVIVIEREQNFGLAKSIMAGVAEVLDKHGKIIVLEDDLLLAPGFLEFMNGGLNLYENEEKVFHVSGFIYPVKKEEFPADTFFLYNASCLGWGTWSRAWKYFNPNAAELLTKIPKEEYKDFNFGMGLSFTKMLREAAEGKISSWAVRWYASIYINRGLSLHPNQSFVNNTGFDGSGVNSGIFDYQWNKNLAKKVKLEKIPLEISHQARMAVKRFYYKMKFYWKLEGLIKKLGLHSIMSKLFAPNKAHQTV